MIKYMKRADVCRNRVIIPKIIIDKFGRDFYMEINPEDGTIILTPIKLEKKGK